MRGVALILVFLLGITGCAEYEIDAEMERLCKADGGTRVFVTIPLGHDQFDKFGQPVFYQVWPGIQPEDSLGKDYKFNFEFTEVKKIRNVRLARSKSKIIRRSDNTILGQTVIYSSSGGWDRIPLSEGPRSECPSPPPADLVRSVFVVEK